MRYTGQEEEARELLNDGFVKVFKNIYRYKADRPFKAWLSRILINTAIDHYRRKQRQPKLVDMVHAQHHQVGPDALQRLSTEEIFELVQQLPPSYRMAFNLYVVDGYTHKEIAQQLDISIGTSKSNLAKARTKLKALIIQQQQQAQKYYG